MLEPNTTSVVDGEDHNQGWDGVVDLPSDGIPEAIFCSSIDRREH